MTISKVENKIIGKQFIGVEIFSNENIEKINCVVVNKDKDELSVLEYYKFNSVSDISLDKLNDLPVIITINTEKVLIKEVENVEKNDLIIVKKAFPNLNLEEFYFDIWRLANKSIISIVRKNYLDEIILTLQNSSKLKITTVLIGISPIKNTLSYIKENTIILNGRSFDKVDNAIQAIVSEQDHRVYEISGMRIKGEDLVSFSGIVSFITSDLGTGSIQELNVIIKNNFLQGAIFKAISRFTVFGLLLILLINYIFFTHYYNKYDELTLKNEQEISNQSKLEILKKDVIAKEKKLKEIALSTAEKITVKVNEISKSIPNTILLEEFQYQPIEKKGTNEVLTLFKENNIKIKGITTDNDNFTNWIESLSKKDFIKEVTIIDFGKNENKELIFTISIRLNEVK